MLTPFAGMSSASAATGPGDCSSNLYLNVATGGCNAPVPYTPGEDQMTLECYSGGGFYDVYGSWHDHVNGDWQQTLSCSESDTAYSVSFSHR